MKASADHQSSLDYPEIVIGMAGPIGVHMDRIGASIATALKAVGYTSSLIKLTDEMTRFPISDELIRADREKYIGLDTYNTYMRKMSEANALRKQYDDPAVLARIAIDAVRHSREDETKSQDKARAAHAYIVRQLKRPEEVALLRKVYGRQFVLLSAYAPEARRKEQLCTRLESELSTALSPAEVNYHADLLIERDASEDDESSGQRLRDTFHMADVFVPGLDKADMDEIVGRFFDALFGKNEISPSKSEYGMYTAKSASLRSADLSRQVGAAIFTEDGELITQGCNEVPKANGGTYWDREKPDHRDIKKGFDPNEHHKREILRDLVERLRTRGHLSDATKSIGSDAQIVDHLIVKAKGSQSGGALVGSKLMDLTEYGRVVHAEMLSITDAARLGRSVKGAILYCTTFPCHNCTKHLLAAGIKRVVYMEPYPKSKAKDLHPDEIELEAEVAGKVGFIPFIGISPYRYRDLFQKGRRKRDDGSAHEWYDDVRRPMIEMVVPSYLQNEKWAFGPMLGTITESEAPATSAT